MRDLFEPRSLGAYLSGAETNFSMQLLLSPHNDDETLFASFTILREAPAVIVVYDSFIQTARGYPGCDWKTRRHETEAALSILGVSKIGFLGLRDDRATDTAALKAALSVAGEFETVYAPAVEQGGHEQHNTVGRIAAEVFPNVVSYMTYTNRGKSTGIPVPFDPEWTLLKLKALACYESQIRLKDNVEHFMRDQREYYAA